MISFIPSESRGLWGIAPHTAEGGAAAVPMTRQTRCWPPPEEVIFPAEAGKSHVPRRVRETAPGGGGTPERRSPPTQRPTGANTGRNAPLRDGCDRCDGKFGTDTVSVFPVTAVTPVTPVTQEAEDAQ